MSRLDWSSKPGRWGNASRHGQRHPIQNTRCNLDTTQTKGCGLAVSMTPESLERLTTTIRAAEGQRPFAYQDSLGYWTVGNGICIDSRVHGAGLTPDEMDWLLAHRLDLCQAGLFHNYPWIKTLSDPRQRAVVEMTYVLGLAGLGSFIKFLDALWANDYPRAGAELLASHWHEEAPGRVQRLAMTIMTGED